MPALLLLPIDFLYFWFIHAPHSLILYFYSFNSSFLKVMSFPVFLRTFFRPLKNEYREGLVGFSICMGIFVKSIIIFIDMLIFGALLAVEIAFLVFFIAFPFLSFYILFI